MIGQKVRFSEILLATGNTSKKIRAERLLKAARIGVTIYMPRDLGIVPIEVNENESTVEANAIKKARAYLGKVDMPIIGIDSALYVDDEEVNPLMPKRVALEGREESEFTQEEIGEKLVAFWKSIARKHGGEVDGYWLNAYALVLQDGTVEVAVSRRDLVLTDEVHG